MACPSVVGVVCVYVRVQCPSGVVEQESNRLHDCIFCERENHESDWDSHAAMAMQPPPPTDAACAICFINLIGPATTVTLPCDHTFHQDCICRWMRSSPTLTCPLCRQVQSEDNVRVCFSLSLPVGTTSINDRAYQNNRLTAVILPEGLVRIGRRHSQDNPLASVSLPSTLTSIGREHFSGIVSRRSPCQAALSRSDAMRSQGRSSRPSRCRLASHRRSRGTAAPGRSPASARLPRPAWCSSSTTSTTPRLPRRSISPLARRPNPSWLRTPSASPHAQALPSFDMARTS